jgi:hypothetical protein
MTKIHFLNITLLTFVIILCTTLISVNKQQIINQMNNWKLLPEPETFTELYFDNHLKLPSTVKINTLQTFSFTIHNEEYKTVTYPYEVYITGSNGQQLIDLKSVTLDQDHYKTIKETFSVTKPIKREEVIVKLTSLNQQIDFWIGVAK